MASPLPETINVPSNITVTSAINLGTINCTGSINVGNFLSPGYSEWYVVTIGTFGPCTEVVFSPTFPVGGHFVYDLWSSPSTSFALGNQGATLITTPGTYYISVHGTDSTVSGNWTLALTTQ